MSVLTYLFLLALLDLQWQITGRHFGRKERLNKKRCILPQEWAVLGIARGNTLCRSLSFFSLSNYGLDKV
jgi:hypothetical protein